MGRIGYLYSLDINYYVPIVGYRRKGTTTTAPRVIREEQKVPQRPLLKNAVTMPNFTKNGWRVSRVLHLDIYHHLFWGSSSSESPVELGG